MTEVLHALITKREAERLRAQAVARVAADAPRFSGDEACPKCASLGPCLSFKSVFLGDGTDESPTVCVEYLEVSCWRCGYAWYRKPIDAQAPVKQEA